MRLFNLFGNSGNNDNLIKEYLANKAVVLDVRTPMEFAGGHVKGSVNIPLQVIQSKLNEIKKFKKPIVAVCQSGSRSGQATRFLKQQGFDVVNGGPWQNVDSVVG